MKLAFVTLLFSFAAFGHGMNKAGPNGGYIRMPGAYHIELVSNEAETKVYVLDFEFKKLPLTKAQISMTLKGAKESSVKCIKEVEAFKCDIKGSELKKYTEIIINSSRSGEKAVDSTYKLPLAFN